MSQNKKTIAVFLGGRSPEHDVSVVTGLQVLSALDPARFDAFPVYITTRGEWLVGDVLRERANYLPDENVRRQTVQVTLDVTAKGKRPALLPLKAPVVGRVKPIHFDVAVPAFHGLIGEDGNFQGLFETANVPYTGMRTMASSVLMDKIAAKYAMQALDIPCLPYAALHRPEQGYMVAEEFIAKTLKEAGLKFPVCVKPVHLGSSIGVARAKDVQELQACLPAIFEYDGAAIIEPFVANLVEYNVAVAAFDGRFRTSAIERPKNTEDLLDFKQKYLSGGDGNKTGSKTGQKNPGQISQGMLSLTRELNPALGKKMEDSLRAWAEKLFSALDGTGAPRIDFIGDSKSGKIWMNEVNPIPGSFGYFLWEAAEEPILFTELLTKLIEEAERKSRALTLPDDSVPVEARLFRRPV